MTPMETLQHLKLDRLKAWEVRAIMATSELPRDDRMIVQMLLCAAIGAKTGPLRCPRFGINGMIDKGRNVWTQYTTPLGQDIGPTRVMSVDDLNRYLGWLVNAIDATEEEYKALVNTVSTWITRDETKIGLHVEQQRAALEKPIDPLTSQEIDDIAASDEAAAKRKEAGKS